MHRMMLNNYSESIDVIGGRIQELESNLIRKENALVKQAPDVAAQHKATQELLVTVEQLWSRLSSEMTTVHAVSVPLLYTWHWKRLNERAKIDIQSVYCPIRSAFVVAIAAAAAVGISYWWRK